MDTEALIALTMKRRTANGLCLRISGYTLEERPDGSAFTKYFANIADRDAAIERCKRRGLTVEIVSA